MMDGVSKFGQTRDPSTGDIFDAHIAFPSYHLPFTEMPGVPACTTA